LPCAPPLRISGARYSGVPQNVVASGLSGGEAFGVFLLVLFLVSLVSVVVVLVYLKMKRPLTYEAVKVSAKHKFNTAKEKVHGAVQKARGGQNQQHG